LNNKNAGNASFHFSVGVLSLSFRRARGPRLSYKLQVHPHHDYEKCSWPECE